MSPPPSKTIPEPSPPGWLICTTCGDTVCTTRSNADCNACAAAGSCTGADAVVAVTVVVATVCFADEPQLVAATATKKQSSRAVRIQLGSPATARVNRARC